MDLAKKLSLMGINTLVLMFAENLMGKADIFGKMEVTIRVNSSTG